MCKLMLCALLLVPASVLAQSPSGTIAEVNVTTPKPGMTAQWEAGRKEHSAYHAAQKDNRPVLVWQIVTGEYTGSYVTVVAGMHWSDIDAHEAFDKADEAEVAKSILPYSASNMMSYYTFRDDLSLTKESAPAKMSTITTFTVLPGHGQEFIETVKKINEGIKKSNYPVKPSRWYSLANGGDGPTFVLVIDRANYAAMETPEKTLDDSLKEVYGDAGAQLQSQLSRNCSKITTELDVYRPDLSYVPQ